MKIITANNETINIENKLDKATMEKVFTLLDSNKELANAVNKAIQHTPFTAIAYELATEYNLF